MKIHEYQAKALFDKYGIPVPQGRLIARSDHIPHIHDAFGQAPLVYKAQIHGGGRGKAGGVAKIRNAGEGMEFSRRFLGKRLITAQTGNDGLPVDHILAEGVLDVVREFYLSLTVDRDRECLVIIASTEGGMEIEKVAEDNPEKVLKEWISPAVGLRPFQTAKVAFRLGLQGPDVRSFGSIVQNMYRLVVEKDCSLVEINPLVAVKDGTFVALDGKVVFDDNGLFRHPDVAALRDLGQENRLEVEASRYNLNYIKVSGSVGCMVNGAGLAMATMDLIKLAGAEPANFLDVGGGATSEMVSQGLRILLSDPDVRLIFINIFGGILRCDTLARGVVDAARELKISLPVIIRLEGTNVDEGRRILADSGLSFIVAHGLADAAARVKEMADMTSKGERER